MIVTIQTPTASHKRTALWEADMMMGLEVENHAGNTFEVVIHDQKKLDSLLSKCSGKVIATQYTSAY